MKQPVERLERPRDPSGRGLAVRRVIRAERRYWSWRCGGDASSAKYRSLIVSTNWAATSSGSAPSSSIGLKRSRMVLLGELEEVDPMGLLLGHRVEEAGDRVAVRVDEGEATSGSQVVGGEGDELGALARSRPPEQHDVAGEQALGHEDRAAGVEPDRPQTGLRGDDAAPGGAGSGSTSTGRDSSARRPRDPTVRRVSGADTRIGC